MKFKGVVLGKDDSVVSRTGNSHSGIAVEAHAQGEKVVVRLYDGIWEGVSSEGIPHCRIYVENILKGTKREVYKGRLDDMGVQR